MIDALLPFLKLTQAFDAVDRDQKSYDLKRHENDAEHSYQLAMIAWYLGSSMKLTLNREKVVLYALVHDLVEVYAGDTAPFTTDPEHNKNLHASKETKEKAAFEQICKEFPDFTDMTAVIDNYEKKGDPESRFVYILDKVLADLNVYLSGEQYYKDRQFGYDEWIEWYDSKFKKLGTVSELEKSLLDEYMLFMTTNKEFYFSH